jgi:hypothetical protein
MNTYRPFRSRLGRLLSFALLCTRLALSQGNWQKYQDRYFAFNYPADWAVEVDHDVTPPEIQEVAVTSPGNARRVMVMLFKFPDVSSFFQYYRTTLEEEIKKANANGGYSSVTFPSTGIANNGLPLSGRSNSPGFLGSESMEANLVFEPYLGAPIVGRHIIVTARPFNGMVGGVSEDVPSSDMWDLHTNSNNILNVISQSVMFLADQLPTLTGLWHTPQIASSTMPNGLQSFVVPLRTYEASFNFSQNGRFTYTVSQTAGGGPQWRLSVTGDYRFDSQPTGLARLTISGSAYTLSGENGTGRAISSTDAQYEILRLASAGFPTSSMDGEYSLTWNYRSQSWELRAGKVSVILSR